MMTRSCLGPRHFHMAVIGRHQGKAVVVHAVRRQGLTADRGRDWGYRVCPGMPGGPCRLLELPACMYGYLESPYLCNFCFARPLSVQEMLDLSQKCQILADLKAIPLILDDKGRLLGGISPVLNPVKVPGTGVRRRLACLLVVAAHLVIYLRAKL